MNEEEMWAGLSLVEAAGLPRRDPTRRITETDVRAMPHTTNLERDISRSCGALVTFTEDCTFVAAHPSVQQFLVTPTETLQRRYPQLRHHQTYYCGGVFPDDVIRQLCTNYLLLCYFSDPKNDEPGENWTAKVNNRVLEHPFSRYTARSWLRHANLSDNQIVLRGSSGFVEGSDHQRLLAPAATALSDKKCSRSWKEIWWYYEKPGLEFPTDGVSVDILLSSGASPTPRLQWVEASDQAGEPARPSPTTRPRPQRQPRPPQRERPSQLGEQQHSQNPRPRSRWCCFC
jgi:hypothetical protein